MDELNSVARDGSSAVNAFTSRGAETRSAREELELGSLDDLAAGLTDVTITRSRAIKLAGPPLPVPRSPCSGPEKPTLAVAGGVAAKRSRLLRTRH